MTRWLHDMKCCIVSSALFVPGQIMRPFRLEKEREALVKYQAELEQRLAGLPERIALLDKQYTESLVGFKPFVPPTQP